MALSLTLAERILRGELGASDLKPDPVRPLDLIACVACCGVLYGTVMGSFAGVSGERIWQVLYSATKVPLLLFGTFLLCLPSFFVFNALAGVRADFGEVVRALIGAQAGMTLALCALAPLTAVWYWSVNDYSAAVLFNGLVFAISSTATQGALRRSYLPLIQRSRKHVLLLRLWIGLYIFVGIQLAWVLRPFVGQPGVAVEWFRTQAWGNAYVEILRHLAKFF